MIRLLVMTLVVLFSHAALCYDDRLLKVPVEVDGLEILYPEFAVFKLPGARLALQAASPLSLVNAAGEVDEVDEILVPPEQGWYHYQIQNLETQETLTLNVFSLFKLSRLSTKGHMNQFRVGHYPSTRLKGQAIYDPPVGMIQVDEKDTNIKVGPNFTIGQFLSKQSDKFPKYVVLRPQLIIKLEKILAALNTAGHKTDGFHIMSGYRTPYYNKAIGNVLYSRHQWGGAADIYIDDHPKDRYMDDLDGSGKVDKKDAVWLSKFIADMSRQGAFNKLGGLGTYGSNSAHGPFVHVDVRGHRARW